MGKLMSENEKQDENSKKNTGRYKLRMVLVLAIVNSLVGILAGIGFIRFMHTSQQEVYDETIDGIIGNSVDMSRLVEWYVNMQQGLLINTAEYINGMDTQEEAFGYIEKMLDISGKLAIIDFDSYKGQEVVVLDDDSVLRRDVDYSGNITVTDSCETVRDGVTKDGVVYSTDIYSDMYKQERIDNLFSLYQPITVDGEKKILLYTIPVGRIFEEGLKLYDMDRDEWLVTDDAGNIMIGKTTADNGRTYGNYYEYIADNFEAGAAENVAAKFRDSSENDFIMSDNDGVEWIFVHKDIKGLDGWSYVYATERDNLYVASHIIRVGVIVMVLTILPWVINIIIIYRQNRSLRRNLQCIAEKNEELKSVDKAKNAFISNMSHEIRTPINAVLGLDEMILDESSEQNIREYAGEIKNAGKTLLGVINDILDYSKISSGKMDIVPSRYDIGSVINDLLNMTEFNADDKGLEFNVNINADIPRILYGDDLRIRQIALNILSNAVKYTKEGSVTLSVDYEKADEENIILMVKVDDTGIGMRKEDMERITKPFERLDSKKNKTVEGTGLGITIVVQLLSQMGSRLEMASEYGKGSTFSFALRQKVLDWEKLGDLQGRYRNVMEMDEAENVELYAPNASVLVVDDTDVNLKVVKGLLKDTGAQVDTALSGEECLGRLTEKSYDIVFLDHRMPGMDGIETLRHIRAMDGDKKDVPVIALTANAVSGARETYLKEGFQDFLPKPVSGADLKKMLKKYISDDILEERKPVDEQSEETSSSGGDISVADITGLKNIDISAGIEACGSEELYREVAMEFAESANDGAFEIFNYLEQEDYENYTIKVHALKSSARLAGAMELSNEALYLEKCGNDRRIDEIRSKTDELLAHYQETATEIINAFSNKAKKKYILTQKEFKESVVAISGFNDAFDYDRIDGIMNTLAEYEIPDELKDVYEKLKKYVFNVDQDNIRLTIKNYIGGIRNE